MPNKFRTDKNAYIMPNWLIVHIRAKMNSPYFGPTCLGSDPPHIVWLFELIPAKTAQPVAVVISMSCGFWLNADWHHQSLSPAAQGEVFLPPTQTSLLQPFQTYSVMNFTNFTIH